METIESIGNEKRLKLCLLGNTSVGKTTLINKFLDEKNEKGCEKTVEEQYSKNIKIKGEDCSLEIVDTGGAEDYLGNLDVWIRSSEGFMLVYSINDKETFDGLKIRYDEIVKSKKEKKYSVIIVGNKKDLEKERAVSKEEVEKFCSENELKYYEVSAQDDNDDKIEKIFLKIAKKIFKNKYPQEQETNQIIKKCCRLL